MIEAHNENGQTLRLVIRVAVNENGERIPGWERQIGQSLQLPPANGSTLDSSRLLSMMEAVLEREIRHRGTVAKDQTYSASLIGWLTLS